MHKRKTREVAACCDEDIHLPVLYKKWYKSSAVVIRVSFLSSHSSEGQRTICAFARADMEAFLLGNSP